MKTAYPVVITKDKDFMVADIPDFSIGTQGTDLADAVEMARDAIGLMGIHMEDNGNPLPKPSEMSAVPTKEGDILTLVDVDFRKYRQKMC